MFLWDKDSRYNMLSKSLMKQNLTIKTAMYEYWINITRKIRLFNAKG